MRGGRTREITQMSHYTMISETAIKVDLWNECLQRWMETRRSDNTRRSFLYSIGDFKQSTGVELHQATRRDVLAWLESMKERGLSAGTIYTRMVALSSFFNFAMDSFQVEGTKGLLESNPADMRNLLPRICRYESSRALTLEEVKRLLNVIPIDTRMGRRDYALVLGYVMLGRRNTEWRLVNVSDFELRNKGVYLHWEGKGSQNVQMVPEEVWSALQEYIQASGGRSVFDPVFLDRSGKHPISGRRMGQILARYAKLAGIQGRLRVHDLRHTAAMLQREAGADVEEIREFLNHKSIITTQIYLHRMERKTENRSRKIAELLKNSSDCDIAIGSSGGLK
jgi:integrase/recombinase XerC